MEIFIYLLLFFFGGALGSFAGVVVDRLYLKSFLTGRSNCDSCNRVLKWFELIPIFSYIFLRGKCRKCKVKIGLEKFLLELFGGLLIIIFSKIYLYDLILDFSNSSNIITAIFLFILFSILYIVFSVLFVYDLRHKFVPTNVSLLLIIIGFAFSFYRLYNNSFYFGGINTFFWLDVFSGFLIALPFYLIYLFTNKKGVGFGDIVIFFGIGYLAGFVSGVSIFFLSVFIGAFISLLLMLFYPKRFNKKTQIPFAPFILIATILVILFQIDILNIMRII